MTSFNTPSTVQVQTQSNWIASNTVFDMRKLQIDPNEAKVWGSQDITGLFEVLPGGKNYVEGSFGRHFEEDRLMSVINATGTTVGALGAVTYTVVAGDTITGFPPVELPYLVTGTNGAPNSLGGPTLIPVRVHEILVFPGNIQGKVISTSPSAGTFVCVPIQQINLPTTVATDEIASLGISVQEGFEGQIDSNNWREHVVLWNTEIMHDAHKTTGTAMAQATWVSFDYQGQTMYSWWYKGQQDAFKQFRNYRELKWVFGQAVSNVTTLPANYSAQYTQTNGLIYFAQSFGNTPTYDITTGQTLEDFENIVIDTLSKNAGSTENALYESISYKAVLQNFLRVEFQNGGIQYNQLGGKDAYASLDFDGFKILGYTFHDKVYSVFNDPTLFGNVSSIYRNFAFWVPMESNMYQCVERKEKVMTPAMRINYLKLGTTSREWIEILTGGVVSVPTNNGDYAKIDFISENAFELFGANRFGTISGVNL